MLHPRLPLKGSRLAQRLLAGAYRMYRQPIWLGAVLALANGVALTLHPEGALQHHLAIVNVVLALFMLSTGHAVQCWWKEVSAR